MTYFLRKWNIDDEYDEDTILVSGTAEECKAAVAQAMADLGGCFKQSSWDGEENRWESKKWSLYIVDERGDYLRD